MFKSAFSHWWILNVNVWKNYITLDKNRNHIIYRTKFWIHIYRQLMCKWKSISRKIYKERNSMTNINEIQTKHLHSIFKVTYLKYIWNCTLKENSEISTISLFRRFHFLIFLTPLARSFWRNIPELWFCTFNIFIFIFCWFLVTFQMLEKNYQTFHPRKDLKTTIACFCCIRTIVTEFQLLRVYKKEKYMRSRLSRERDW